MAHSKKGAAVLAVSAVLAAAAVALLAGRDQVGAFPGAVPGTPAVQKCGKAIAKAGQGLMKARLKSCDACAKKQAKDQESDSLDCSTYDPTGQVPKAISKAETLI